MRPRLFLALIVSVWLGLDFFGLMVSVLGTYFYFGWEGTPYHEIKLGLVSLLVFSGPLAYALLLRGRNVRREVEMLLVLQMAACAVCAAVRQTDVFAWTTVAGTLVSGVAAVALLRRLREFSDFAIPVLGFFLAVLLHLWARILGDGFMPAIRPIPGSVVLIAVLGGLAVAWRGEPAIPRAPTERPERFLQWSALASVLLLHVGIALFFNFNLWSAATPGTHASVYSGSFGIGTAAGYLAVRFRAPRLGVPIAVGTAGAAFALGVLVRSPEGLPLALFAHGAGCFGMGVFGSVFARRCKHELDRRPGGLPLLGLQAGSLLSMVVIASFLDSGVPTGFWFALGIGAALLGVVELLRPIADRERAFLRRAPAALLLVPVFAAVLHAAARSEARAAVVDPSELTVLTTNARYGWTDDFRFEPEPYLRWLQKHPVAVLGMQEVNKGGFYGGFTDVFEYYRNRLPGRAIYGDASFGFGNALFTTLAVRDASVTAFSINGMIRRSYVRALVEHDGREIEIFVAHVSHGPHPNGIRQAQVAELVERVRGTTRPWILMGDMNADSDDPEIRALVAVAHPVFRERPELRAEKTYPSVEPRLRLDYVFFSEQFDLVDQAVLDTRGTTDHRAVRVTLRLVR